MTRLRTPGPRGVAMTFLHDLLKEALGGLAVTAVVNVAGYFVGIFKQQARGMKGAEVRAFLEQLGATSTDSIRELVGQTLAGDRRISGKQREDLTAVLIALARGASLLNSQ